LYTGLGFVKQLVKRDDILVFAGVRDPTRATELQALTKEYPGKLHTLKLASSDEAGNRTAIEEIKTRVGRLDVITANAGNNLTTSHSSLS
jgi:NADP-dependent 3-hydroxy acid dehydrogenase YdfG